MATISSASGSRSAIAAKRNATPSSAAWRRSSGVVANVRPADRALRLGVPAGRALAAEEGEERETVVRRVAAGELAPGRRERPLEPGVEVAAVGERAALDDAALVQPVEEEARPRPRALGLVDEPQRAGGADHERGAASRCSRRRGSSRRRRARRAGRRSRQPLGVEAEHGEELGVPVVRRQVEQAGRGGHREARLGAAAEIVGERDEAGGPAEEVGLGLREPGELRGPERRVEVRAGARVHLAGVEAAAQRLGRAGAARVAPAEDRRQRLPAAVDRDEAVREARRRVRLGAAEDRPDERGHLGGVGRVVALLPELAGRLGALVEALRAYRRGADVEGETVMRARPAAGPSARARGRRAAGRGRARACRARAGGPRAGSRPPAPRRSAPRAGRA